MVLLYLTAANREQILYFVRDIANPSMQDEYFPVARHKDFYIGHSWASGVSGGTRTQESSSEVTLRGILTTHFCKLSGHRKLESM